MSQDIDKKIMEYRGKGISRIKLAVSDIDGVLRGKYLDLEKFESIVKSTGGFCDCVFGWDVNDALYDNSQFTGWHTAYPDALFKIDLSTERFLKDENVPFFLAEFVGADGRSEHPVCPRNMLRRVLKKAEALGFGARLAFEYEFFLFEETPHSVREKNYLNLKICLWILFIQKKGKSIFPAFIIPSTPQLLRVLRFRFQSKFLLFREFL